jgi:hypothetical protein
MFRNVTPVAPPAVLEAIESAASGAQGNDLSSVSNQQLSGAHASISARLRVVEIKEGTHES